ncbi:MAG: class I SAM-dependent methyltransferase [bacterium]|nr:class I SAM-dependent methyltransferase [bacterium]
MKLTPHEQSTIDSYNQNATTFAKSRDEEKVWILEKQKLHNYKPHGKIIDIGSGSGRDAKDFIRFGYEYTGIDYSDGLLSQSRINNPGVTFLKQSVYDLDFPKNHFDLFWACAILLHMPKKQIDKALQSIHQIIKIGAIGCITLKKGEGERFVEGDHTGIGYKRFFSFYLEDEFKTILEKNSFEILESYTTDHSNKKWLVFFVKAR